MKQRIFLFLEPPSFHFIEAVNKGQRLLKGIDALPLDVAVRGAAFKGDPERHRANMRAHRPQRGRFADKRGRRRIAAVDCCQRTVAAARFLVADAFKNDILLKAHAKPAQHLHRQRHGAQPRLHIAGAKSIQLSVPDFAAKRVRLPRVRVIGKDGIHVAVEQQAVFVLFARKYGHKIAARRVAVSHVKILVPAQARRVGRKIVEPAWQAFQPPP